MDAIDSNVQILWRMMNAFESGGETDSALAEALTLLRTGLNAEIAVMWLLNQQDRRLYAVTHSGEGSIVGLSIDCDSGLQGKTVAGGEPLFVADAAGDPRFPGGSEELTNLKAKNAYYVPMMLSRSARIGCVQIVNKASGSYTDAEVSLCRSFAGLAAMVIDEKGFSFAPAGDRKVILSFRNVVKDFPSGTETLRVLKGVDLDIYENEFLVILGESGCGKSTMLNIIGGMDSMTEGTMLIDGMDFSHPTDAQLTDFRRDTIGFIFQSYNLMPNLTALENIEFIAENTPAHGEPREALELVGLTDKAGSYPSTLSGGQQQRVSIARAIVKNPRVILADEPTAALDFATGKDVLRVIEKLVKEARTTVVMVTHNVEIAKMANRVVRFKNGKIASIQINLWPLSADDLVW